MPLEQIGMKADTVYKLSESPLVIMGSFATFEQASKIQRPFTYIYHNAGWIRPGQLRRYLRIARRFRGHAKIFFATNEPSEAIWLRLFGLQAACFNHNLHVRENFFVPLSQPKQFDAVYAAQMAPFKRLHLASQVRSLNVITYQRGQPEWNLHAYAPELSHSIYNPTFISREAVRDIYQRSRVGLALSKIEGAMFSSCEYLLCGLPVVSTPNRGGRDHYFEPWYAATVAAHPTAVAAAVERLVAAPPDAEKIRRTVIAKMHRDRLALLELLTQRMGVKLGEADHELERLWGGLEGIEKHAIPVSEIADTFIK